MDTNYQYNSLLPNTVYVIDIFPSLTGAIGNADDKLVSSWIVETVDNGQHIYTYVYTMAKYKYCIFPMGN